MTISYIFLTEVETPRRICDNRMNMPVIGAGADGFPVLESLRRGGDGSGKVRTLGGECFGVAK